MSTLIWPWLYENVYNNKVMCHLSMKLSDKCDLNQMYTSDKIVVKHISVKETPLKLNLEPMVKVMANNRIREQNLPPNKQTKALLGNCSVTDEL